MDEYYEVLKRVNKIPGFEDYRNVKQFSDPEQAAVGGPVVLISVSGDKFIPEGPRCDALVITRPGSPVTHVPLPNFSHKLAEKLHIPMVDHLRQHKARDGGDSERAGWHLQPVRGSLRNVLETLWTSFVRPILEGIQQTAR